LAAFANAFPLELASELDQWTVLSHPLIRNGTPFDDPSQQYTQGDNLSLCQLNDWDIQYSVEWKVTKKNRAIIPKVTEPEQAQATADYWERSLKPKLD